MGVDWWRGAACTLVLAAACAHVDDRPPGPEITRFDIEGNEQLAEGAIKDRIVTDSPTWVPFTKEPRFNRNVWAADVERVQRLYQARGFYQAQVSDEVEYVGRGRVALTLRVVEGQPTRIQHVEITGLEALPEGERAAVLERIGLGEGDVFVEEPFEAAKDRVLQALHAYGYAEAEVEIRATVDLGAREATVRIGVEPGLRYRFGAVQVKGSGADEVEPWRIEELVRESVEYQAFFSPEAMNEAQRRIVGLGVFGAVRVVAGEGDPGTGTVPVVVDVTDAPLRELALGGGLGVEQLRWDASLVARFTHRNFLGGLRHLSMEARAGWAFIPNVYSRVRGESLFSDSGPIGLLAAKVRQPRFLHPNLSLTAQVELKRDLEPAFSFIGARGRVSVPWHLRSGLLIETSYNFELYRLDEGFTDIDPEAPRLLFGCGQTCSLSYLEQAIALDRRDDPLEPKRGYYLGLAIQEGGGPLGGSFDYVRILPEVRGYVSVLADRRLTFSGRIRVGTLIPIGGGTFDSPIVARFFSGGDGMRGFGVQRLSPTRLVERRTNEGRVLEPVPIGGNGLFESSLEVRYALTPEVTLATFVDAGFVTSQSVRLALPYFSENLLVGVGGGVRYRTPVGTVRLDVAFRPDIGPPLPVFDPPSEQPIFLPGNGCFGFGRTASSRAGSPEGICSIHLSVGEAF
ncbi:MAG: BamA/TamA family outer membrane protein [Myxococcaceae bacterium]